MYADIEIFWNFFMYKMIPFFRMRLMRFVILKMLKNSSYGFALSSYYYVTKLNVTISKLIV